MKTMMSNRYSTCDGWGSADNPLPKITIGMVLGVREMIFCDIKKPARDAYSHADWRMVKRDDNGCGYSIEFERSYDGQITWGKAVPPSEIRKRLETIFFRC